MNNTLLAILLLLSSLAPAQTDVKYSYPKAFKSTDKIEKFGHSVDDPYRWLEDIDSKETKDWLSEEDKLTDKYKSGVFGRYNIVEHELVDAPELSINAIALHNKVGAYYFTLNFVSREDNAPDLEYKEKLDYGWTKLLSTSIFQKNKTDDISIVDLKVSADDSFLAVGISHGGSDWVEIRIMDMNSKKLLNDVIPESKYGFTWGKDGVIYNKYVKQAGINSVQAFAHTEGVFYHRLGTALADDKRLTAAGAKEPSFYVVKKKWLVTYEAKTEGDKTTGTFFSVNLDSINRQMPRPFISAPNLTLDEVQVLGVDNGRLVAASTYKAPHGRILSFNPDSVNDALQLVEMYNQTIAEAHYLQGKLFCIYLDKGNYTCFVFDNKGKYLKSIDIPPGMNITGFNEVRGDSSTYYYIQSFAMPPLMMRFNLNTLKSESPSNNVDYFFSSKYVTKVVSYKSRDSMEVYMYLTYNKDIPLDGNNPVFMYAYGGFGIITGPRYDPGWAMLLKKNVILAVPLVRGGGEMGTNWHRLGKKKFKQNSVDDLSAAASWLINNKYTNASKIALNGGSHGAWLIAEAAVQHPELFKAVIPQAGIYDMLRYNLYSSSFEVGLPEFGNPDDSLDFDNLLRMSPVYSVKKGVTYPSWMMFIGKYDNRVVPFHTYKLLATLQENGDPTRPYLMYREDAGHNVENATWGFQQLALMYTFVMIELGIGI